MPAYRQRTIEPRHDKTNKVSVRPAKTQISLGIRPVWSEFFAVRKKAWVLRYTHWVHSEDSDQTHNHFVGFVMSWLNYVIARQKLIHFKFKWKCNVIT